MHGFGGWGARRQEQEEIRGKWAHASFWSWAFLAQKLNATGSYQTYVRTGMRFLRPEGGVPLLWTNILWTVYFPYIPQSLLSFQQWRGASVHCIIWTSILYPPLLKENLRGWIINLLRATQMQTSREWGKLREVRGDNLPNFLCTGHSYISWMNHLAPQRKEIWKDVCSPERCQFHDHLFSSCEEKMP